MRVLGSQTASSRLKAAYTLPLHCMCSQPRPISHLTWHGGRPRAAPPSRSACCSTRAFVLDMHTPTPANINRAGRMPACLPASARLACVRRPLRQQLCKLSRRHASPFPSPFNLPRRPVRGETRRCSPACTKPLPKHMSSRPVHLTLRATSSLVMAIKVTRSCRFIPPPEVIRPSVRHPVMLLSALDILRARASAAERLPSVPRRPVPLKPALESSNIHLAQTRDQDDAPR